MCRSRFAAFLFLALCLAGAGRSEAQTPIPSFPGALGFGGTSTGATTITGTNHTGGTVYHVTNLNDSGAGSFRTGVGTSGNIVVFDVGGSIRNLSAVSVASHVSIEGQTAPGGIQVFGAETSFYGSSNIICRYMHFRDGTLDPNYPGSSATNSHTNAVNLGSTTNVIMDHCCFEFAAYNNIDATEAVNDTIQYCIFADPISEQQFNCHIETGPVTFIDNLWANSGGRNPLGKANLQFVNNIVYNWGFAMTSGNSSGTFLWDVLDNYFITGPNTNNSNDVYYQVDSGEHAYATGNYLDTSRNGSLQGSAANTIGSATKEGTEWSPTTANLPALTAQVAFYDVVSSAGPLPRDQVDSQVVTQVLSLGKQGMRWGNQTSTGLGNSGYGVITSGTALPDSDASGMPDDWKAALGLSMTNPAVGGVTASNGYTNLENYVNWKAQPNAWVAKNTAALPTSVSIDLSQYTNGFASGSTFTVSNVIKGTATQSGAGGYLVNYVPTTGTSGLGGFNWSVANGVTTMTGTFGVLISQSGPSQSVTWKGDGATNAWNLSAANWTAVSTGSATDFGTGDPVTFNDTGSISPAVNINTTVSPGTMTFNTYANNYTLSGTGTIGGTGALVKEGASSLTISNSGGNTYSGGAVINSGAVYMNNGSALGSGAITLNGGDLEISSNISFGNAVVVNEPSTLGFDTQGSDSFVGGAFSGSAPLALNFNNSGIIITPEGDWSQYTGTLTVSGNGNFRFDNTSVWGFPNAMVNLQGANELYNRSGGAVAISLGQLTGGSASSINGSDQGGAAGSVATYVIGSLNLPSTFAGSIVNSGQIVGLTATGSSMLTLSGYSTYTGPTTVASGTLLLTGTLGNTNVIVSSGATFISSSLVSGTVTLNSGGSLYLGGSTTPGAIGTLTLGHGLVTNGGSIYYDLSGSPSASGSNDLILVNAGNMSVGGTLNFVINLTNGVLGAGTYNLISSGTAGAALGVNGSLTMVLDLPIPAGGVTRQTFALNRPASGTNPGYIHLIVTGSAGALTWSGTGGATWDLNTTAGNWSGGTTSTFYDLDTVTFNDSGAGGAVTLSGTMAPSVINVSSNVTNYTFSGAGILAGGTELVKTGSATLTISTSNLNTFTGPVYLNAGTINTTVDGALGVGTIYLNGGSLALPSYDAFLGNSIVVNANSTIYDGNNSSFIASNGATLTSSTGVTLFLAINNNVLTMDGAMSGFQGTLEFGTSSGTLRLDNGGSALAFFDLGTGNSYIGNRNGGLTDYFGAIQGGPGAGLSGRTSGSGGTSSTYVVGALNLNTTFAGTIINGGDLDGLNITKVGTGNWTLSGTSNFAGNITVQQGTLTISGSDNNNGLDFETESGATLALAGGAITTETVQIDQGAYFTGYGTINGNLVNQGTNSVTNTTGTVTINGPLTVNGNLENDGVMTVGSGGALYTTFAIEGGGTVINTGTLDLRNSPQTALPAGYVNTGTILTSAPLIVLQGLVWQGDGSANMWNLSAQNWTSMITGSATAFGTGDPIVFTDGGSTSPAVNIATGVAPGSIEVSATASNFVFSGAGGISGSGGLEMDSAGTLTLSTTNAYSGDTIINSGVLFVTGGSIAGTGQILIGGSTAGSDAAMYQSGASMVTNTNTALGAFAMGPAAGTFGYYNLASGTLNVGGEIDPGGPSGGAGTFGEFDMSGGTVNLPNIASGFTFFLPNRGGAGEASVVNISGGTVRIAGGATPPNLAFNGLSANWNGAGAAQTTAITISGSGQFLTPSLTVKLNVANNTTNANAAILNLGSGTSGGALQTLGFGSANGAPGNEDYNAVLNFNGGTLEAGNAANATFLQGLGAVYIYGGGGTINNNDQAITIGQTLLAPSGQGVTAVGVATAGTGYMVPPEVTFSGGGGSGATAYATISATTGAVTGIVITNPGTGYTTAPAAALTGTTNGVTAVPGTVAIAANATTGGMTFTGGGTTTLTAVEGYTGPTIVNSGTLVIANATNAAASGLNKSSSVTINNGGAINVGVTSDNALFGSLPSAAALLTINTGGTLTVSDNDHLEKLVLAGGTLAENGAPTADQASWGVYDLDNGVTAGGTAATSTISAQDVALTESGGTIFNVSPGATNGIDLYVSGGFAHASLAGIDTGLIKTGSGVMVLAGASNFTSATTVSAGTLGIAAGGALTTTGITVSPGAMLAMAGGAVTTGTVQIGANAFFNGYGVINATLVNTGTDTVNGPLTINGNFQNNGTMIVTGSGTLTVNLPTNGSGSFVNNGTLDIMDSPQTVLPAGYVNNGTILNSALVTVQQVAKSANTFSVMIQSYTGHTYQLQESPDLNTWQNVGAAQSGTTGSVLLLTDTNASASGMFYQIGVGP